MKQNTDEAAAFGAPLSPRYARHFPRLGRGKLICRSAKPPPCDTGEGNHAQHGGRGTLIKIYSYEPKNFKKALDESFVACYIMTVAPMRVVRKSKPPQT